MLIFGGRSVEVTSVIVQSELVGVYTFEELETLRWPVVRKVRECDASSKRWAEEGGRALGLSMGTIFT